MLTVGTSETGQVASFGFGPCRVRLCRVVRALPEYITDTMFKSHSKPSANSPDGPFLFALILKTVQQAHSVLIST